MKHFSGLLMIVLLIQFVPNKVQAAEPAWWKNEVYTERQNHRVPALTFKAPADLTVAQLIREYRASTDNNIIRSKVNGREFELSVITLPSFQHNYLPFADHVYLKKSQVAEKGFLLFIDHDGRIRREVSDEKYLGLAGRHALIVQFEQEPVDEKYFLVRMMTVSAIAKTKLPSNWLEILRDGKSYFDHDTRTLNFDKKKLITKDEVEIGMYRSLGEEDELSNMAELEKLGTVMQYANHRDCKYCIVKAGDAGSPPIENGWLRSRYPWVKLIISEK